jgi:excisionase family DNA binding protein
VTYRTERSFRPRGVVRQFAADIDIWDVSELSDFLTPDEIAAELKLGKSTVYRALEDGRLPGTKVCGRWRTLREQLAEAIRDRRIPQARNGSDPMPGAARRRAGSFRQRMEELEGRRVAG